MFLLIGIYGYWISVDIRTFEVLLRTYEVREVKMNSFQGDEGGSIESLPCKRQCSNEESNGLENFSPPAIMARPSSEARGHTCYLTFARLKCVS